MLHAHPIATSHNVTGFLLVSALCHTHRQKGVARRGHFRFHICCCGTLCGSCWASHVVAHGRSRRLINLHKRIHVSPVVEQAMRCLAAVRAREATTASKGTTAGDATGCSSDHDAERSRRTSKRVHKSVCMTVKYEGQSPHVTKVGCAGPRVGEPSASSQGHPHSVSGPAFQYFEANLAWLVAPQQKLTMIN